ncbi:hypothetical protein GCM10009818_22950 [Nakamurella flavida]
MRKPVGSSILKVLGIAVASMLISASPALAAGPAASPSSPQLSSPTSDPGAEPAGPRGTGPYVPLTKARTTTSSAASTQAAGNCGVRTDTPHVSYTTANQIHTRVESFCTTGIVSQNTVSATTYRSRWYGWENRGSASAGPRMAQTVRVTVAIDCTRGEKYRYRTTSRGVATINGTTYTAASYDENNSEITCGG